jgi:hypothetical protein
MAAIVWALIPRAALADSLALGYIYVTPSGVLIQSSAGNFLQRKSGVDVKTIGKILENFLQKSSCIDFFFMYAQFSVSFLL